MKHRRSFGEDKVPELLQGHTALSISLEHTSSLIRELKLPRKDIHSDTMFPGVDCDTCSGEDLENLRKDPTSQLHYLTPSQFEALLAMKIYREKVDSLFVQYYRSTFSTAKNNNAAKKGLI